MSDTLREEISSQGMAPALIDKIIDYADTFREANTAQENLKESTKELTQEITTAFNAIYDEMIGICKIASAYYQYEPLKKEQFTFSKAIDNLGAARKVSAESV
jgi:seryl-tRNA synthetase